MKKTKLLIFSTLLFGFCFTGMALEKFVVALDWYINPDHGPMLVAKSLGYYKKHGLDVKFISPTETAEPSQLVAAGKADVAITYEPMLIAQIAGGMPLKGIGVLIDHVLCCVATLKSSGISKMADFKGKKVGYSNDGTGNTILKAMLKYNGVTYNEILPINLQMNLSQALLSKRVDAVYGMMKNVEPIQLEQMGVKTNLFYPEDNGVPTYSELMFAAKDLKKDDEKIKKFLNGVRDGVVYLKKYPQKSWELVAKDFKESLAMTPDMAKTNHEIWNATIKYFADHPEKIDMKRFYRLAKFLYKHGTINKTAYDKILKIKD